MEFLKAETQKYAGVKSCDNSAVFWTGSILFQGKEQEKETFDFVVEIPPKSIMLEGVKNESLKLNLNGYIEFPPISFNTGQFAGVNNEL